MRKILVTVPFIVVAAACAPVLGPGSLSSGYIPQPLPMYGASFNRASGEVPIGRWDNVMFVPHGAALQVLANNGTVITASFVTASYTSLRLRSGSREFDIPA